MERFNIENYEIESTKVLTKKKSSLIISIVVGLLSLVCIIFGIISYNNPFLLGYSIITTGIGLIIFVLALIDYVSGKVEFVKDDKIYTKIYFLNAYTEFKDILNFSIEEVKDKDIVVINCKKIKIQYTSKMNNDEHIRLVKNLLKLGITKNDIKK